MTVYVALDAVRAGKLTLDTPLVMSARAARMPPSKMGFRPGTEVTLDNALKMLMVKSPNDIAVMVAEGVSGSVEAFANDMNAAGQRLGLHESHFVNPNGLHDPAHVSSARDMAMIARALLREFPEHADLFSIGALQLGKQYIANHNGLLGRYPGADGMKTGFTCPAGFNVVASANHSGRRLIVVVLGVADGEIAQPGSGGPFRSRLRHGRRERFAGVAALVGLSGAQHARRRLPAPQRGGDRRRRGGGSRRAVRSGLRVRGPRGRLLPTLSRRCWRRCAYRALGREDSFRSGSRSLSVPPRAGRVRRSGARPVGAATRVQSHAQGDADRPAADAPSRHEASPRQSPSATPAAETKAQKVLAAKTVKPKTDTGGDDK